MDFGKLLSGITDLFGKEGGLGDILGSQGFKNIMGGGMSIWDRMQAGDLMDFQKDMWKRNEARSADLFQREKQEEEARHALDF